MPLPQPNDLARKVNGHNPVSPSRTVNSGGDEARSFHGSQSGATKIDFDIAQELADLPSDAFASSSSSPPKSPDKAGGDIVWVSSQPTCSPTRVSNLVGPQSGLKQMTLFGDAAQRLGSASQANKRHNWPLANKSEPPTHHKLDLDAMKTYVYPTNLGTIRDYQYNIVARALYHNLLVALPTGLGKTFIAATVMLNYFRWTTDAQIVFVAPTKPLVSQQVEACFGIAGIPRSKTTMLTGGIAPGLRAEEWSSKRVFFMTPQTIINDLKSGICDPKKIVLLVVDEAHRATGAYAYVEVVKFIRRFNQSFRVLALTATPGASVEAVQEVIDGLDISRVEIRTEHSLDIRQYVHSRKTETITFDNSEEMELVMELFSKALQPVLNKLTALNAYWLRDPMQLSAYGLTLARQRWMGSGAGRSADAAVKGMANRIFTVLASLAHSIELLKYHGIGPFYHGMVGFRNAQEGVKGGKYEKEILESEHFQKMMTRVQFWINNPTFIGHPKLDYLQGVVLKHFLDAGEDRGVTNGVPPSATRIMIFAHYRDSAEEIVRVLKRSEPMIRPHVFVGQAASKGSEGMDQKHQLEIIQQFKLGTYNTLVATSIGEEGLDIGEIDLIVCYDSSASPIRMLQRMGRTGRKRAGNIILLLMKGKEENWFIQAKDNYAKMQAMIAAGTRFTFHDERSPRIVPLDVQPVVDKMMVTIPAENTQAELPEPTKKRGRAPKRPTKKFHMPDGVRTGFVRASRMGDDEDEEGPSDEERAAARPRGRPRKLVNDLEPIPSLDEVLLSKADEQELDQRYRSVPDGDDEPVGKPQLSAHPIRQRNLGSVKIVKHSRATISAVRALQAMGNVNQERIDCYKRTSQDQDVDSLCGEFGAVSDDGAGRRKMKPSFKASLKLRSKPGPKPGSTPASHVRLNGQTTSAGKRRKVRTVEDAVEGMSSSPPRPSPCMQLQSQGISLGYDTSGEEEREEADSELNDFIVDEAETEVSTLLTSSATVQKGLSQLSTAAVLAQSLLHKPFYVSQELPRSSDSDNDLPDPTTLGRTWKRDYAAREHEGDVNGKTATTSPKKRQRRIIDDSSE